MTRHVDGKSDFISIEPGMVVGTTQNKQYMQRQQNTTASKACLQIDFYIHIRGKRNSFSESLYTNMFACNVT